MVRDRKRGAIVGREVEQKNVEAENITTAQVNTCVSCGGERSREVSQLEGTLSKEDRGR